ncbi:MAG: hypothetical protein BWX80_04154 [Candidatus Hydrogenedentes bacterium ADurb.Bin101]|nr:MAG: hypothetical protein BWX80_04154 [Candidatus Hydrogenedentes bacterium ADurb.Bin101]
MQAEGIGQLPAHGLTTVRVVIAAVPHILTADTVIFTVIADAQRVAEIKACSGPRAAGIFPLRLRGQTYRSRALARVRNVGIQRRDKGLRIIPGHTIRRIGISLPVIPGIASRPRAHHRQPLRLGHLIFAHVEIVINRHGMHRALITPSAALGVGRTHLEGTRRNAHQFQRHVARKKKGLRRVLPFDKNFPFAFTQGNEFRDHVFVVIHHHQRGHLHAAEVARPMAKNIPRMGHGRQPYRRPLRIQPAPRLPLKGRAHFVWYRVRRDAAMDVLRVHRTQSQHQRIDDFPFGRLR